MQSSTGAYDSDPAETAADLCLRLGFGPKNIDSKSILERRAALAELTRAHIEALRGSPEPEAEDGPAPDAAVVPFAQAKAQGPPH